METVKKKTQPSSRYRLWIVLAVGFSLAAAGAGAVWWWHESSQRRVIVTALPTCPDLAGVAVELRGRVRDANEHAVHGPQQVSALGGLARLYHANGFLPEALLCYKGLEQLEPKNPRWKYRHALVVSGFGEFGLAVSLLRQTIELDPNYMPARLRLGEILLKDNQLKEAIAVYEAAQTREPGEPYSLLGLARCDMDQELWSAACEKLEKVVASTNYALGYDLIVPVYEHLGMNDRAAEIRGRMKAWGAFRDMADPWMEELNADCYDAYQLSVAAGAFKVRGEKEEARTLLERAVRLAPKNAPLHFQFALLLIDFSEYAQGKRELELCTQLDPTFADGWSYLSGVLSTMGDAAGAQQVFTAGLAHCPDSPGLRRMYAKQLQAQGRVDEAIQQFRESIRLRSTDVEPYIELGMALLSSNRTEEALKEFNRALVAEPENPMALSTLAFYAISTSNEAAARQWMQRARNQPRVLPDDLAHLTAAFRQAFGRAP
jgi:tetratricopeptide (TPR) repeat protein